MNAPVTSIFPEGLRLLTFDDGYRVQISGPLPDGRFIATPFKERAQACDGPTREAAVAAAMTVIAKWRAEPSTRSE